ncbi:MAG: serine hydrolase [Bacteroidia bacterium]|nr:serine hydrolase [Bacteroidia bacterium]
MPSLFYFKKYKIVLLIFVLILTSCQVSRFFIYNFADIRDYKKFPSRKIEKASAEKFHFTVGRSAKLDSSKISYEHEKNIPIEEFIKKHKSVAFLIIRNDTILYEKYFRGRDSSSYVPSFSAAKSYTSALIGCAIADSLIGSENDLVIKYIPELAKNGFDNVTIKHLLQMTSGLKFGENYFNPFGDVAGYYYGRNLRKRMCKMKLKREPGKKFEYLSGNTQLLGFVLERALKGKSISQYLQEKIWQPCGMESDATWSIDMKKKGIEKTFCCLNANARDFAKFGRLYLNKGNWNGKQLVPEAWVKKSNTVDTTGGAKWYYQNQWWINNPRVGDYSAIGFLGQYIYVNPKKHIVIVRLGKTEGGIYWPYLFGMMCKEL